MSLPIPYRKVILGAANSNLTGTPTLIADFRQLTVSIQSSTGSASRYTVVGTNDDGLRAALGTPSQTVNANGWSVITTILSAGLHVFDPAPAFRWINMFRDGISVSAASNATVVLAART